MQLNVKSECGFSGDYDNFTAGILRSNNMNFVHSHVTSVYTHTAMVKIHRKFERHFLEELL